MPIVKIYLKNINKVNYDFIIDGLSDKKISSSIHVIHSERSADLVIDCEELTEKKQFEEVKSKLFKQIWDIYNRKLRFPKLQRNQKKIRKNGKS